jgi:hypothetical protein
MEGRKDKSFGFLQIKINSREKGEKENFQIRMYFCDVFHRDLSR